MAEKRSIPAREALADIRVGMTDDQLMAKHSLTEKGLRSLKNKLGAAGLLDQAQTHKPSAVEVPPESDTKVLARNIAEAVRAEWSDDEIARAFGLLSDKLPNLFPLLIKHGYLTQEDYDRRQSRLEEDIDIELDFEPASANGCEPAEPAQSTATRGGAQIPLRGDSKTMARGIADAVKAGCSDEGISMTFGLPAERLANVFAALIEYGYLTQEDCDRQRSRREGVIDVDLNVESTLANARAPVDRSPFAVIRGRTLLASLFLAAIATFIASGIIWAMWGLKLESPLGDALSGALFYAFLLLCAAYLLYLAKLSPVALLGPQPPWSFLKRSILLVFLLIGFSIAGIYLLYLPLSYLAPGFVKWLLLCHAPRIMICTTDYTYIPVNLLNFFTIVLIAPVVEEFITRGLLLTRWSLKWNVPVGILASSIIFAFLHFDIIGSFFFGFVMSVLYIQTRSLFVPIGVYVANNGIVWMLAGVDMLFGEPYALKTVTDLQSSWWVGLLAGMIVLPWVILFTKRHFPKRDWRIPYLALQETT